MGILAKLFGAKTEVTAKPTEHAVIVASPISGLPTSNRSLLLSGSSNQPLPLLRQVSTTETKLQSMEATGRSTCMDQTPISSLRPSVLPSRHAVS